MIEPTDENGSEVTARESRPRARPTANGGPLKPLPIRPRLGDEVTKYLRDALWSGLFATGTRMNLEELAIQLGVSTMPVREALQTLATEGLLESHPRRGFWVAPLRGNDVSDVFRVHAFVAGLLAEEAARSISDADLEHLGAIDDKMQTLASSRKRGPQGSREFEELNYAFHRLINHASDSPRLRWFLRACERNVPRRFYGAIPGYLETAVADHPGIIEALERRDTAEARLSMEQHVARVGARILDNLARSAELGAMRKPDGPPGLAKLR